MHAPCGTARQQGLSGRTKHPPKPVQWRLEALAYSLVEGIAAAFPGSWVCRCGEALGGLAWHLLPGRRKTVLRNLRIAFHGELDSAAIARLAKASFRRTGSNLFGATRTAALDRDALAKVVEAVQAAAACAGSLRALSSACSTTCAASVLSLARL